MRCRWLSLCTVWPPHSQISSLSRAILVLSKARSRREPKLGCKWLTDLDDVMWCFAKKENLHESCRMGRRIVVMKLICSLGHCECDGHTKYMLSQRRLTADCLAPQDSDYSRMHSKVSSAGCQVTSRPRDQFSRYSKWLDTFRTALVITPAPTSKRFHQSSYFLYLLVLNKVYISHTSRGWIICLLYYLHNYLSNKYILNFI